MLNHWKDHFHPHEGNNHKPPAYHKAGAIALGLLVLSIVAFSGLQTGYIQQSDHFLSAVLPSVLTDLTNEDREEAGLDELTPNKKLKEAAQMKANHMAENEYFSHDSPSGVTPWEWFSRAGYEYETAGENLAINFSDSADVEQAWMDSPPHRENILEQEFTEIGIATAKGEYEGEDTVYVAQMFARPSTDELASRTGIDTQQEADTSTETDESSESTSTNNTVAGDADTEDADSEDQVAAADLDIDKNSSAGTTTTGEGAENEEELATTTDTEEEATSTDNSTTTTIATDNFMETASLAQVRGESGIALNPASAASGGQQASRLAHLLSQPEFIFKTLMLTLFGLVALSLLISVGVEAKRHHVNHAVKTLVVLVLLLVIFYLGTNFLFEDPSIATYSDNRLSAEISLVGSTPSL